VLLEIDFLIKNLTNHWFNVIAYVQNSYLNTAMCNFESSRNHERRLHAADSSKNCRKPRTFNCECNTALFLSEFTVNQDSTNCLKLFSSRATERFVVECFFFFVFLSLNITKRKSEYAVSLKRWFSLHASTFLSRGVLKSDWKWHPRIKGQLYLVCANLPIHNIYCNW